jgi:hypothetical protein
LILIVDFLCQNLAYVLVNTAGRRDAQFFFRGVDILHVGADGYGIEVWSLFDEKSALHACVDGFHLGFLVIHVSVDLEAKVTERRVGTVSPTRVFSTDVVLSSAKLGDGADLTDQSVFFAADAASNGSDKVNSVFFQAEDTVI